MVVGTSVASRKARTRQPAGAGAVSTNGSGTRRRLIHLSSSGRASTGIANPYPQVAEEDRRRLAQELHDEVGHLLTAAILRLERALGDAQPAGSRPELEAVRQLLRECAESVQDVAFQLQPRVLSDLGLLPAMLGLARRAQFASGIPVCVSARGDSTRVHPEIELAAFRIAQEAITNALKYSSAERISVRIRQSATTLVILVTDNGRGFDPALIDNSLREHRGLRGMQERASPVGGQIEVRTRLGRGTTVRARFDLGGVAPC